MAGKIIIKDFILKPGVGFVPFSEETFTPADSRSNFDQLNDVVLKGEEFADMEVERDGNEVSFFIDEAKTQKRHVILEP